MSTQQQQQPFSFYGGRFRPAEQPAQKALDAEFGARRAAEDPVAEDLRILDEAERGREEADPGTVALDFAAVRLRLASRERERQRALERETGTRESRTRAEAERRRLTQQLERDQRLQSAARMAIIKLHFLETLVRWNLERTCHRCARTYRLTESMGRWECR
jgi:hypothetical protein